jgi:hypothetical protein
MNAGAAASRPIKVNDLQSIFEARDRGIIPYHRLRYILDLKKLCSDKLETKYRWAI